MPTLAEKCCLTRACRLVGDQIFPLFLQRLWQDVGEGLGPHLSFHHQVWALQPEPQLSGRRQPSPAQPRKLFFRHQLQLRAPDQKPQPQQWPRLAEPLRPLGGVGRQHRGNQVGLFYQQQAQVICKGKAETDTLLCAFMEKVWGRRKPREVWVHAGNCGQAPVPGMRRRRLGIPLRRGVLWGLQGLLQEDHPR